MNSEQQNSNTGFMWLGLTEQHLKNASNLLNLVQANKGIAICIYVGPTFIEIRVHYALSRLVDQCAVNSFSRSDFFSCW